MTQQVARGVPAARGLPRQRAAGDVRVVADPPAGTTRVLFIGGAPRSGSTLLDLMLGQLPGHCDIGELFYMWRAGPLADRRCACGQVFSACRFWQQVGQEAFGGWDAEQAEQVLRLQRQVDRTVRLPLLLLGPLARTHRQRVATYLELTGRVYAAIAAVSGARVVVDSTKRPSTAYLLRRAPAVELGVVLVVRDPRGVVNSWSRPVAVPAGGGPRLQLKQRGLLQVLRRWVTVNVMTELLARRVPTVQVRYEDLVRDPVPVLHRVLALSGTPVTEAATAFLTPEGLRTGGSHALVGGRVRLRTGPLPLQLDEAWRAELPGWKRAATRLVTGPLMRRYGYR
jgi:hypothetical protein